MGELSVMLTLSLLYGNMVDPETGKDQNGHHWSYAGDTGPSHWTDHYPRCAGQRQSPVNIRTGEVEYASWLTDLQFRDYDNYLGHGLRKPITVKNNGHTASMAVTENLILSGAHLTGDYQLAEMHLHWGSNNSVGSEHALDNKKKAAEVHFVHYAKKYGNLSEAMQMSDGLAVIGVFVELVPDDTYAFDSLANGIDSILEYGKKTNISNIRISDFLPRNKQQFYHYRGSLTTPPCYESVLWFVMMNTIYISERQLDRFRHLQDKVNEHVAATGRAHSVSSRVVKADPVYIRDNFRPLQPLYGRKVYCNTMRVDRPQLRNYELPAVKVSPIQKYNDVPTQHIYNPPHQHNTVQNVGNQQPDYIFRSGLSGNSFTPGSKAVTGVISNGNSLLIGNISPSDLKGTAYQHMRPDYKFSEPRTPVNPINMGSVNDNDRLHVFKNPDTASVLSNGLNNGKSAPLLDYIFTQMHGLTRSNSKDNQRRYHANDYPALSQPKDRILPGLSDLLSDTATSRVLSNPFLGSGFSQSEISHHGQQNYNANNNLFMQNNNNYQTNNNYRSQTNNNMNHNVNYVNLNSTPNNNYIRPSSASYHSSPRVFQKSKYMSPTAYPNYQQPRTAWNLGPIF